MLVVTYPFYITILFACDIPRCGGMQLLHCSCALCCLRWGVASIATVLAVLGLTLLVLAVTLLSFGQRSAWFLFGCCHVCQADCLSILILLLGLLLGTSMSSYISSGSELSVKSRAGNAIYVCATGCSIFAQHFSQITLSVYMATQLVVM